MGKHQLSSDDEQDGSEQAQEEPTYLVEVITKARVLDQERKRFEFMVKWHGYTSDDDTWEPENNVKDCKRLLKSFWKNVGKETKDDPGPRDTIYEASKDWIKKERRHFQEELEREKAEKEAQKKAKAKERERERTRKAKAAKVAAKDDAATQSRSSVRQIDSLHLFEDETVVLSDSDEDGPSLGSQSKNKGKGKEAPRPANVSPTTFKIRIPKKAAKQPSSAPTPTNKYAGMKITKKPVQAPRESVPVVAIASTSSESGPAVVAASTSSKPSPASNVPVSASFGSKKAGPSHADESSEGFLPPRPRNSIPVAPAAAAAVADEPAPASGEDVDNFLATMMPFGHSEAQRPENLAARAAEEAKKPPPSTSGLKFIKKWTWTGELLVDTVDTVKKLCDATIHSTSETSDVGFRLMTIMDDKQSLRFSKGYTSAEMNLILQGLRKVDQIAKIGHRKQEDQEPLTTFMKYLIRRNLIIACAGISQLGHVAEMIVFPAANKELCERLNIPLSYKSADCLLVALMPWHVPPSKYSLRHLRPDELRDTSFELEIQEIRKEYTNLALKPHIETAIRMLGFDFSFVKFLPMRKFCVWSRQVDPEPTEKGRNFSKLRPETKALLDVLSFLKARNVGYDDLDARIIFVHVGSVRNIQKLPNMVSRRANKPEVQFITYGTHESVKPSLWGFREIYPLGGIVTFTATALLESPFYVAELIEQIHKHPHWECYILPSVLAVFVRLSCPGEDPVSVYTREPYRFGRVFDLIEEGKVAMMQSPCLYQGSRSEFSAAERDKWVATQFSTLSKTPVQTVEESWTTFVADYSNKSESELRSTIESEIVKDLTHLEVQPAIRESYRRFVVIKATQDEHINMSKEGFEWRTAHEFTFGDGFPAQRVELTRGADQPLAA